MNLDKLYSILTFISLFSEISDASPLYQSPDYLDEKFKRYIGDYDDFEFPNVEYTLEDVEFIDKYISIWGTVLFKNVASVHILKNILCFINRANWDSATLPSYKILYFTQVIGSVLNLKSSGYMDTNIHNALNNWIKSIIKEFPISEDLDILIREFNINEVLK